jgi:hypothetical protein
MVCKWELAHRLQQVGQKHIKSVLASLYLHPHY